VQSGPFTYVSPARANTRSIFVIFSMVIPPVAVRANRRRYRDHVNAAALDEPCEYSGD
jgi:hypothetical protein